MDPIGVCCRILPEGDKAFSGFQKKDISPWNSNVESSFLEQVIFMDPVGVCCCILPSGVKIWILTLEEKPLILRSNNLIPNALLKNFEIVVLDLMAQFVLYIFGS